MRHYWLLIAALSGFFCVAFGAFAAHGLARTLSPDALGWIDTGLQYQMFHSLAILVVACLPADFAARRVIRFSVLAWTLGIILFSGSLYALALGAGRFMVWLTPLGGTLFLIGWLLLAYGSLRSNQSI